MLRGLGALLAVKIACCGLLLLSATGMLAAVLAFLSENHLLVVAVGVAVAAAPLIVWYARLGREPKACPPLAHQARRP